MAGVIPAHVLVHTAVPVSFEEPQSSPAEWIEGEPGPQGGGEPVHGPPFACVLFLPGPGGDQPNQYRPRAVRTPTLLYNPTRTVAHAPIAGAAAAVADGSDIVVGSEDELLVAAPELASLTGGELVRWQVDGVPQGFGRPGTLMGVLASLRQVRD